MQVIIGTTVDGLSGSRPEPGPELVRLDDRGSFAWLADRAEPIERASAALAVAGGCLVADPVDFPGLDAALAAIGPVVGVVTLLDRHQRDAAALAARHGAPRLTPRALGGTGVPVEGVEERTVVSVRGWHEALLWLPDRRLLVCAETVGTGRFYRARPADALAVHPLARLLPVRRAFAGLAPEVVACGHGPPLAAGAAAALDRALARKWRDLPRAWARAALLALRAGRRR